jgi:tRNA-specific 2-thiouridylase
MLADALALNAAAGARPLAGLEGLEPGARVVVAMSGGVDSSVVAALVKSAGFEAVGITLQLYDHGAAVGRKGACCAGQDIHDARRVAEALDMPHYVLDYENRFRREVIEPFAGSYAAGETPVPCVLCNQRIKFADLLETARDLGAAAMATGHYVRRVEGAHGPELWRGAEAERDQSYFLFATRPEELAFLRFPLGGLTKAETRDMARRLGLGVAAKPDSQDICFVPDGRYADVVARLKPEAARPGDIVDLSGRVLGRHQGVGRYTIGQRRGLGLGPEAGEGAPVYVVRVEPEMARVVVGPREALATLVLALRDVNWLGDGPLAPGSQPVEVKIRSVRPPVPARLIVADDGGVSVVLDEPEMGVAPGQACVFYAGERVLGGGWIGRTSALSGSR